MALLREGYSPSSTLDELSELHKMRGFYSQKEGQARKLKEWVFQQGYLPTVEGREFYQADYLPTADQGNSRLI